jgi:hypothetical protein
MSADVNISGPARQLLRVRDRAAVLARAEGLWDGETVPGVRVIFGYADNGERLQITLDRAAWEEMRRRIDRAFVPVDLPGQMRLL